MWTGAIWLTSKQVFDVVNFYAISRKWVWLWIVNTWVLVTGTQYTCSHRNPFSWNRLKIRDIKYLFSTPFRRPKEGVCIDDCTSHNIILLQVWAECSSLGSTSVEQLKAKLTCTGVAMCYYVDIVCLWMNECIYFRLRSIEHKNAKNTNTYKDRQRERQKTKFKQNISDIYVQWYDSV